MSSTIYQTLLLLFLCLPLASAILMFALKKNASLIKILSLASMIAQLIILFGFGSNHNIFGWNSFGPLVVIPWLGQWGIQLTIGLDGLTFPFL